MVSFQFIHPGLGRYYKDIELMIGYQPCIWWKICWGVVTPLMIIVSIEILACFELMTYLAHLARALGF